MTLGCYFGVGHGLERFLYLDASRRALGAMLGETVIAEPYFLEHLMEILGGVNTGSNTEPQAFIDTLKVATVLLEPDALIAVGLKSAERDALKTGLGGGSRGRLKVFTGRDTVKDPARAAASLPFYTLLGYPDTGSKMAKPSSRDTVGLKQPRSRQTLPVNLVFCALESSSQRNSQRNGQAEAHPRAPVTA